MIFQKCLIFLVLVLSCSNKNDQINFIDAKFKGHISAQNVHVREQPSLNSTIIGQAFIGTKVYIRKRTEQKMEIKKLNNYWYYCLNQRKKKGWIYGAFIKKGNFEFNNYIKKLAKIKQPQNYSLLESGWWTDCDKKEWKREPSCESGGYFFDNNILFYGGSIGKPYKKVDYNNNPIYLLTDHRKENNKTIISFKLIINSKTWLLPDKNYKKKVVIYDNKKNYIEIDGIAYYNANSFR